MELAKERLPEYGDNFWVANGLFWDNPLKFDYVRTELVYVPEELQREYLERIVARYLAAEGKLILTEYRSRKTPSDKPWIDSTLIDWGYDITGQVSGFFDDRELVRVSVIKKQVR